MKLICIYGYSFGCFVLVFLLCIVPAVWLHWLLMVYGTLNSIAFLVLNLTEYLESLEKKSYVVYGIIGAAQIFLFLMFKLVFFDLIYETPEWNDVSLSLTHWQLYFLLKSLLKWINSKSSKHSDSFFWHNYCIHIVLEFFSWNLIFEVGYTEEIVTDFLFSDSKGRSHPFKSLLFYNTFFSIWISIKDTVCELS